MQRNKILIKITLKIFLNLIKKNINLSYAFNIIHVKQIKTKL